jgi:hypothetical protein
MHRPPVEDTLVVRVTAFGGVVWGRVTMSYSSGRAGTKALVCARRKCEVRVPHGATVSLVEKPRDPKSWPFRSWIVHNGGRETHIRTPQVSLVIRPHLHDNVQDFRAHVRANYYNP